MKKDNSPKPDKTQSHSEPTDLDVCTDAPEFAEHARPNEPPSEPCDDGRAGITISDKQKKEGKNMTEDKQKSMNKKELCKKIEQVYPDIGECGIDLDVTYDNDNNRWKILLKKDNKSVETFLKPGDAQLCMEGRWCVILGIEISRLKDSIEKVSSSKKENAEEVSDNENH
jgi:hypothetical protein